jgi:serine protease Do
MFRRTLRTPVWVAGFAVIFALLVGGVAGQMLVGRPVFTVAAANSDTRTSLDGSFAPVVQKVTPSVVNIWSSKIVKTQGDQSLLPFLQNPFFRQFFGDQFGQLMIPRERRERSLGSGVVVSPDGYILTNNHVVEGASDIKVSFSDKREFPARVIGTDAKTDLAVVKIDQKDLTPITLGDSTKVEVGDLALAIGNPFGLGRTVTMGVVSAKGRGGLGIEEYEDFIQTDAAINPGNSGGALVNVRGELIGVNTAILSGSGGNQGIGFAVPTNMARYVMEQIVTTGKVSRAFLGVTIQEVTPDIAKAFKLEKSQGALVGDVAKNSPADKAGIQPGDVILGLNGNPIPSSRELQLAIAQMKPGTSVRLTISHDGNQRDVQITLSEQPAEVSKAEPAREPSEEAAPALDGVNATVMTPEIARQLELPANTKGVVITGVASGSAAAEAGLQRGDVVLQVNRTPVTSVEQFDQSVRAQGDQPVILFINREGHTSYIDIPK